MEEVHYGRKFQYVPPEDGGPYWVNKDIGEIRVIPQPNGSPFTWVVRVISIRRLGGGGSSQQTFSEPDARNRAFMWAVNVISGLNVHNRDTDH